MQVRADADLPVSMSLPADPEAGPQAGNNRTRNRTFGPLASGPAVEQSPVGELLS
jgi:hypothetical protein